MINKIQLNLDKRIEYVIIKRYFLFIENNDIFRLKNLKNYYIN